MYLKGTVSHYTAWADRDPPVCMALGSARHVIPRTCQAWVLALAQQVLRQPNYLLRSVSMCIACSIADFCVTLTYSFIASLRHILRSKDINVEIRFLT